MQFKPPNCPALIKAAQQNETQAGVSLAMAVKNMNVTLTALNKMVADSKAAQVTESTKYQAALTLYNKAMNAHDAATTMLQNDQNKLKNVKNECAQPVHPPNCQQLVAAATAAIANDTASVAATAKTMMDDNSSAITEKGVLDAATAAYWNAVSAKNTTVAQLQANLTAAIAFQKDATEWYEEIVVECQ
eukprot:SAG22_NODE_1439_length_4416_cov_25.417940_5_plen_189_part_00